MTTSHTSSPATSSLLSTASNVKPGIAHRAVDLFPAVLAGLIAVLISYAGPMLLMLQAAQAAHLTSAQTSSWLWAVSIGSGLSGAWMSWRYKIPVICAWNTPGAALLVTALATLPYNQAIAAYLFAAAIIFLIGATGIFEKLMAHIPKSLCAAMLAGILMRFGVDVFASARSEAHGAPYLVGLMFIAYLFYKKRSARYAIVLTLLTGVLLWSVLGWGDAANTAANSAAITWQAGLTLPVWTTPEFSVSALLSLGLPLALLCLTGQQVPGVAVLRAAGYERAPSSKLVSGTGLASLLLAPFGAHGVNLAAITAAICTGPEAHHQPEKRWVAGLACGVFYLLIGSFAGSLTTLFLHLPHALVTTVAGLALLGAIQNGLVNAMQENSEREAALITFIVTASNISLLGLGSACWGIALGVLSYYLLRVKTASHATQ
ncbi:benzoate/H(+) symporter BenE family transporter [Undibacterium sp. CY18W]|uniref:Benzoate/H(+) symporter BenE family transporter n=1 Tax=Undibacterium hunanense TaxID=2762292 RepID=A0ABR6ZRC8_9BURK|nr:benzoate/H(+) symporter BenE family transporter [Undibacterium hunanense]MBC3918075.1 benzoate/H(+) symporter BenE family transporter [Undibacterium hunanense]